MANLLLIAVLVIVIAGAGVAAYYYSGIAVPTTTPTTTTEQPAVATTGLTVAKQMQSFIDSRRTADGFYKYSYNCERGLETDCGLDEVYPSTNAWTTLSNLALYKATGDSTYLDKAKRDADAVIDWCKTQPNNGRICLWILVQISELYKETGDAKYSDFLLEQGPLLLAIDEDTDPEVVEQRESRMMRGIEARELAAMYAINKGQAYLDEAAVRIEEAYENLPDSFVVYRYNGNEFRANSCWPELANMEIYEATGDSARLSQALDLLDTFDPGSNAVYIDSLTDSQPCAELYIKAYGATGNASYREGAEKISATILKNRWDTPKNNFVSGSGTLLSDSQSHVDTLTDVAYMVRILADIKDSELIV